VDTPEEADRLYNAFSDKANTKVCVPYGETFWAHRFGMFEDQFGVPWMINCEKQA
jgi:PhnB protein